MIQRWKSKILDQKLILIRHVLRLEHFGLDILVGLIGIKTCSAVDHFQWTIKLPGMVICIPWQSQRFWKILQRSTFSWHLVLKFVWSKSDYSVDFCVVDFGLQLARSELTETSRDQSKSAPYLRVKKSKRTSKVKVFFSTLTQKPKSWTGLARQGPALRFFINSVA